MQILYLIKYKNLNCQTALGRGYVDGNSVYATTGATNAKGMYYGETTGKLQCKCHGIEDLWGNYYTWVDGLFSDASWRVLTAYRNFNDTGSGYPNSTPTGLAANIGGYTTKMLGNSLAPFITTVVGGSTTTYYCDYGNLYASRLAIFGSYRSDGDYAGVFCLPVTLAASFSGAYVGSRLMFL